MSEIEVARIERDDCAVAETVGLTLDEGKRLTASTQAEIVPRAGRRDGRAVPMVRAPQGEALEQGLLPGHVSLSVR
jgi:hypothetical protein